LAWEQTNPEGVLDVDVNKVSPGQRIAAIAGGLLFIDLWMHWYSVNFSGAQQSFADKLGISTSASAWTAFSMTDILIAIACIVAISGAVCAAMNVAWPLPIGWAQLASLTGGIITLLILYRIVNQPGPNKLINVEWGAYIGFLLSAGMAYGAWRASTEDVATTAHAAPPPPAPTAAV